MPSKIGPASYPALRRASGPLSASACLAPHSSGKAGWSAAAEPSENACYENEQSDLGGDAAGGYFNRGHDETSASADDVSDVKNAVWTFGHRSPQALEFNHLTKQLWGTEMGPMAEMNSTCYFPGRTSDGPYIQRA